LSPRGDRLAFLDDAGQLWAVGAERGREALTLREPDGRPDGFTFAADGAWLAVSDHDPADRRGGTMRVRVWDLAPGGLKFTASREGSSASPILASPDGRWLAVGGKRSWLWDVARREPYRSLLPGRWAFVPYAFSPDGKLLLWRDLKTYRLSELLTGELVASVTPCDVAAFSPDGAVLALAREGGPIVLQDVCSGERLLSLPGHGAPATALAFAPDGRTLVSASRDTTLLAWDASTAWRRPAVRRTAAERDRLADALAGRDAAAAWRAVGRLAEEPEEAVRLIERRVRPAAEDPRLARLVARLDDDSYAERESAARELERAGSEAEAYLRRAAESPASLEQRRRAERLLRVFGEGRFVGPDDLAASRAVALLERIGGPEAWRVLRALAGGAPWAARTRDARAALRRLGRAGG
jgi:hypothetical protein